MSVVQVGLFTERLKIPEDAKALAEDDPWKYLAPNPETKRKQATIAYEGRVRELENEVEAEQRRSADAQKNARKADRRIKELLASAEEDKKIVVQLQEMLERMNGKLKVYKKQVEEAEEVANMNLQKFRKVAHELEEAQERAEQAEAETAKLRVVARSGGRDTTSITAGPGGVSMRSSRARMFDEE